MPGPATPLLIQGGMGVAVSSWQLAAAVARTGQLGVVSGTALDLVVARRLQDGDAGGHVRRALEHFPLPEVAERVLARYLLADGRPAGASYAPIPRLSIRPSQAAQELAMVGNFVEVWLAKEGHDGPVGINFLEKIQMATPSAAYGAMLAGVDYVLMGAGIPREIPQLLDHLAKNEPAALRIDIAGSEQSATVDIDPVALSGGVLPPPPRPLFLAIVSAHALAGYLARDVATRPDGFIVEGHRAGGHNAPPRGKLAIDGDGQPRYGPRDDVDLARVAVLGLPFWLAGTYGAPERLARALELGAAGVQVGTVFAFSEDSGFTPKIRGQLLAKLGDGTLNVRTDASASPTGFPFKVVELDETLADRPARATRPRLCDLGYLRTPYLREGGAIGYRCPAEPVHTFIRKGGTETDTVDRACLCNALAANVGLEQTRRDGYTEQPLVTLGADLDGPRRLLSLYPEGWSADQAVRWLLGD